MKYMQNVLSTHEVKSFGFLLLLIIGVGIINPGFFTLVSIVNCFNDSVVFTLLSCGIAFVILTGEIDVSVGSILGLTAAVGAGLLRDGMSYTAVFIIVLALGAILGLLNSAGIAWLGIPSLIFTLGTNGVIRGLIYVYTGGCWVENIPAAYTKIATLTFFNTITVLYFIVVMLICIFSGLTAKTKRGKFFIAVGDNASGAALIGIPVQAVKIAAYGISGIFASLAGLIYAARIGFVTPMAGNGYEMKAIAACVLGGISLSGGRGRIIGAAIGAVIMSSIGRMLVFLGFSSHYDNAITGSLLIAIVVLNTLLQNKALQKAKRTALLLRCAKKGGLK